MSAWVHVGAWVCLCMCVYMWVCWTEALTWAVNRSCTTDLHAGVTLFSSAWTSWRVWSLQRFSQMFTRLQVGGGGNTVAVSGFQTKPHLLLLSSNGKTFFIHILQGKKTDEAVCLFGYQIHFEFGIFAHFQFCIGSHEKLNYVFDKLWILFDTFFHLILMYKI